MRICKKCGGEIQSNFCPNCGQPQKLERINRHYVLTELGSVLNLQKGIFYTIKELLLRPGKNIRQFIKEDRNRLVKPILFILICSLAYTIFVQIFNFKDAYINYNFDDWKNSATGSIFHWISQNYGYTNILMAVFIALWIKIFFNKYEYNYFEILILLCFVIGIEMLLFALVGAIEGLTNLQLLNYCASIILIYGFWAVGQFFDKSKIINYLKAFFAYSLGLITFNLVALGIGLLIDLIK